VKCISEWKRGDGEERGKVLSIIYKERGLTLLKKYLLGNYYKIQLTIIGNNYIITI